MNTESESRFRTDKISEKHNVSRETILKMFHVKHFFMQKLIKFEIMYLHQ